MRRLCIHCGCRVFNHNQKAIRCSRCYDIYVAEPKRIRDAHRSNLEHSMTQVAHMKPKFMDGVMIGACILIASLALSGCSHIPAKDDKAFRRAVSEDDIYASGNVNTGQIEVGDKIYFRDPKDK